MEKLFASKPTVGIKILLTIWCAVAGAIIVILLLR